MSFPLASYTANAKPHSTQDDATRGFFSPCILRMSPPPSPNPPPKKVSQNEAGGRTSNEPTDQSNGRSPPRLHFTASMCNRAAIASIYPSELNSTSPHPSFISLHTHTHIISHHASLSLSLHHMSNCLSVKLKGCLIPHGNRKREREKGGGSEGLCSMCDEWEESNVEHRVQTDAPSPPHIPPIP